MAGEPSCPDRDALATAIEQRGAEVCASSICRSEVLA